MLPILFVFVVCYQLTDSRRFYPHRKVIDEFKKSLTGYAIKPGDSRYQNVSTMKNSFYYRHPGLIVMASSVEDVQKSVLFAKRYNLHVTVHSSGHDYNGRSTADGSLMIDLSSMKEININLNSTRHAAGEVTVDSGNSWLGIYKRVQSVDRVVVGGSSHTVSPGGYTLGGGHSPISRSFGLASD
ncbi:hypothetical protein CHS0354_004437 [Potamilus streckersoni]|uniref:FAD-binding PCMH-type domain-containing protein n=1 Tax=Potamilus streckersoni TaxID=2493646 RepID=A0AAE0TBY1_9BIVA|nr:hypothetical protein CHS0354_004437 [Potamilus streckersoni]